MTGDDKDEFAHSSNLNQMRFKCRDRSSSLRKALKAKNGAISHRARGAHPNQGIRNAGSWPRPRWDAGWRCHA
jgi:hypothetical protein